MTSSPASSLNDISILLVSEKDDAQGGLFREYFHNFPNVAVTKNPFEDLEVVDCLVIPCPSSFCAKGNEITDYYMSRLPDRTRDKIHKYIQLELLGEQQPGTAFIVKNSGKNEKYKYIAFLCLTRVADGPMPMEFAYTAMRGMLLAILDFNKQNSTSEGPAIEVIAVPSFALNSSSQDQKRLITRHMSLAYRNMFYPMKHLASVEEAKILNSQLNEKSTESVGERRNKTREMLLNGELIKRGLYNDDELKFLIDMIESENDLRQMAAKALAHFVHDTPSEFTLSMETICSAISKSKTGLPYMLDEAESGTFSLFKEIKPEQLIIGSEIGNGTEASVFKATWNGLPVAVKKFRGIPSSTQFQRELSIMSLVQHPNLVRCYGGYSDTKKDEYYLVMDLMATDVNHALHQQSTSNTSTNSKGGSPINSVNSSSNSRSQSPAKQSPGNSPSLIPNDPSHHDWDIKYPQMLKIAIHTARGLEYLHDCNLIHRDLKSVNLLIDQNYNAKVCDFGLSRVVAPKNQNMTGNVGTVSWIAPEVFEKQPYDAKADVYSFGIVLWELFTKQIPFQDLNTFEIPIAVIKGDRPVIPKDCPKDYAKLMALCWHKKPSKRPTFQKIVKSLVKISKAMGVESAPVCPSSPGPMLHRTGASFSQSATTLRGAKSVEIPVSFTPLEESTTSSSKSEEDDKNGNLNNSGGSNNEKPKSIGIPKSASASLFPRRRTASSASIGDSKVSSNSSINLLSSTSKKSSGARNSSDYPKRNNSNSSTNSTNTESAS